MIPVTTHLAVLVGQVLAQAESGGGFIQGASKAIGLIVIIGFIYGLIKIIGGAAQYNRDPDMAKQSIVSGLIIAGAFAIVQALFAAFDINTGLSIDMSGF